MKSLHHQNAFQNRIMQSPKTKKIQKSIVSVKEELKVKMYLILEFRIDKDGREELYSKNFKTKLKGDSGPKLRDKNSKGAPFNRESGDFRDLRKTYQMLNENEKGETLRKTQKIGRSGISSDQYSKYVHCQTNSRKKNSFGGRNGNLTEKGFSKNGFKNFKMKNQDAVKYEDSYQKSSNRSIENNIKSKKKKFYSIDK